MATRSPLSRRALDLSGNVVLVTGSANGIGAETARQLTAAGAHVLHCRTSLRCEAMS
ncbi:MAG: SDR family NAD(P)-dependent oxidoreductase [Mycobacterium sp.]